MRRRGELAGCRDFPGGRAVFAVESAQRRLKAADDDRGAGLHRTCRWTKPQHLNPLLDAIAPVQRAEDVVERGEVHALLVDGRQSPDVRAGAPAPIDDSVGRFQAIEEVVGRAHEQLIVDGEDLVRLTAKPPLPYRLSVFDVQRDDAGVVQRHVHAIAVDREIAARGVVGGRLSELVVERERPDRANRKEGNRAAADLCRRERDRCDQGSCTTTYCGCPLRHTAIIAFIRSGSVAHQTIIVLDFGSQYTQLTAPRLRALSVYSEVWATDTAAEKIADCKPAGILPS